MLMVTIPPRGFRKATHLQRLGMRLKKDITKRILADDHGLAADDRLLRHEQMTIEKTLFCRYKIKNVPEMCRLDAPMWIFEAGSYKI